MRKSVLALVMSTVIGAMAFNVVAHDGKRPGEEMRDVLEQLNLSTEQKQQLRESMQAERKAMRGERGEDRQAMREIMQEMANVLDSDTFNEAKVTQLVEQRETLAKDKKWQRVERQANLYAVLDADQREALLAIMAVKRNDRQQSMADRPEREPKWQKGLALTDAQQAELDTLQQQQRERMQANRAQMQAFHTAEQALITSGNFSQAGWDALYTQYQPGFVEAGVEMAKQRYATLQILTPQQRAQMQDRQQERREMWQERGHREGRGH